MWLFCRKCPCTWINYPESVCVFLPLWFNETSWQLIGHGYYTIKLCWSCVNLNESAPDSTVGNLEGRNLLWEQDQWLFLILWLGNRLWCNVSALVSSKSPQTGKNAAETEKRDVKLDLYTPRRHCGRLYCTSKGCQDEKQARWEHLGGQFWAAARGLEHAQHCHKETSSGLCENFWGYHGNVSCCVSLCVCLCYNSATSFQRPRIGLINSHWITTPGLRTLCTLVLICPHGGSGGGRVRGHCAGQMMNCVQNY